VPATKPIRIFHITAIANLPSIARSKKLYANAVLIKKKMGYGNIAYQGAQGKRATKIVAKPPGGVIHDYVPFYFAPRSPMLYTVNRGNVPDCPYRQEDIVHIVTTVEAVIESRLPYVFYDCNATLTVANCYNNVKDIDKIDWALFQEPPRLDGYCKYFHDNLNNPKYARRRETRQAEFLVQSNVPIKLMTEVGTYNETRAVEVRQILDEFGVEIQVQAKPDWYFQGQ